MSARMVSIKCLAADPVPCPETFTGGSEGMAARRLLEHLDALHVHDNGGPCWGLSWRDDSGEQRIGVVHDVEEQKKPMTERMDVDTMAKILCRIESRRTGRSFDEVVAPGIELWTRHRYEAEQLLEELSDWCFPVARTVDPEPWVDQDGDRWSTAKKDGYLSHGPSTFTWEYKPRGVVGQEGEKR